MWAALAVGWAGGAAAAGALEDAQAWFCEGEWRDAAVAAEAEGSVEGYLLASVGWRVHGRYGGLGKDGKEAAYGEAIEAAEEGLRIAPEDHRLRAALSSALARRCTLEPVKCVLENTELKRAREELEAALDGSPNDPAIRAALGAWHARAGVAGIFLGADAAKGRRLLDEAETEVGNDIPILFEMARAWKDLGDSGRAAALYRRVFELPASCVWEKEVQKRARGYFKEVSGS